jgi:hypothetical protein
MMRELADEQEASLSRRAFLCDDELGALLILTLIPGARAAGASAMLTAYDPARFTVMDTRALQSLTALGTLVRGSRPSARLALPGLPTSKLAVN